MVKLNLVNYKNLINNLHDFYIPYRDSLNLSANATFGIEVEFHMEGYDDKYKKLAKENEIHNPALYFLKTKKYRGKYLCDSELHSQIELISPVLIDEKETWKTMDEILSFLVQNRAFVSENSGGHIHIGKQLFENNPRYLINFLKLWSVFEAYIVKFSNGEMYFERTSFAGNANYSKDFLKKIIYDLENENFDNEIGILKHKSHSLRISATNDKIGGIFTPNAGRRYDVSGTIEVRCPNGTLNKTIWQNNINFFCKMILSCCSDSFDTNFIDVLYKNFILRNNNKFDVNEQLLCDIVFNNELDKLCFLRQYYKDFNEPKEYNVHLKSAPFWK